MAGTPFFIVVWARVLQLMGIFVALYGIGIATLFQASKVGSGDSGMSFTLLIPLAGIVFFIWGSKILYDRGHNILI